MTFNIAQTHLKKLFYFFIYPSLLYLSFFTSSVLCRTLYLYINR